MKPSTLEDRRESVHAAAVSRRRERVVADESRRGRRAIVADLIGLGLVVVCLAWIAHTSGALALPRNPFWLMASCAVLLVISRVIAPIAESLVPAGLVVLAAMLVATYPSAAFDARPDGGLFDYSNANAAFFVQAAAGSVLLVGLWRPLPIRAITLGAATIFSIVPFSTGTHAGMIAVGGLIAVMAVRSNRSARFAIALAASAFILTLSAAGILAARYDGGASPGIIERIVDRTPLHEHRVELWHEALVIMVEHPVTGVGPGRFAEVSALAQEDVDSRYARNEFLQFGAEAGVIGLVLLVLLFVWGFLRLLLTPRPTRVTAIAAVALAALGMHACVDYVLHFPAVPLAAAALVGTGIAAGHRREPG
jgi:O-antigen ligase